MDIKIEPGDRIAPTKKQSNKPIIIALALVCSIAGAVGHHFYKKDQELQALRERLDRQEAAEQAAWEAAEAERRRQAAQRRVLKPTPHYDEVAKHRPQPSPKPEQPQERQTVFNDANYTPRGAVNSVPPPAQRHYSAGSTQTRRTQANTVRTKWANWKWESYRSGGGGRKSNISGRFEYLVQNGRINTSSVCRNEEKGSIRYRDCRKGARAYFESRCKSGDREACTGANMMP